MTSSFCNTSGCPYFVWESYNDKKTNAIQYWKNWKNIHEMSPCDMSCHKVSCRESWRKMPYHEMSCHEKNIHWSVSNVFKNMNVMWFLNMNVLTRLFHYIFLEWRMDKTDVQNLPSSVLPIWFHDAIKCPYFRIVPWSTFMIWSWQGKLVSFYSPVLWTCIITSVYLLSSMILS